MLILLTKINSKFAANLEDPVTQKMLTPGSWTCFFITYNDFTIWNFDGFPGSGGAGGMAYGRADSVEHHRDASSHGGVALQDRQVEMGRYACIFSGA